MKDMLLDRYSMRLLFLCMIFQLIVLGCTSKEPEDEIVILTDEVIQEFITDDKGATKKYKNRIFQMSGTTPLVETPEEPATFFRRFTAASGITFEDGDNIFSFGFDFNVIDQYPQLEKFHRVPIQFQEKDGDKVTVQGEFERFSTRIIHEYEGLRKGEVVEWRFFSFKKSQVIEVVMAE